MLHAVSRQLVYGLYELIHTHAPNIHSREDWQVLFTLLEVCGAGSSAPALYRAQIAASLPDEFLAQARAQPGEFSCIQVNMQVRTLYPCFLLLHLNIFDSWDF